MKKNILFTFSFFVLIYLNSTAQNTQTGNTSNHPKQGCLFLSESFSSLDSALEEIDNTRFSFQDTYYPNSTNITKAFYYACEKKDEHLISSILLISTVDKNLIFKDVSKETWNKFKKAKSADKFFKKNIKNKYKTALNENID